jgi:arylformamidase
MNVFDISRPISQNAVVYPGDDQLGQTTICDIGSDCPCRITALVGWTTHFLTHVDPPRHFVAGGKTLDQIPLSRFICDAVVIEAAGDAVLVGDVARAGDLHGKAVLFKTRNSFIQTTDKFDEKHVYISEAAARAAVQAGANMLGTDYLSVDRYGDDAFPAHRTLLGAEVLILEGLDLSAVNAGVYKLSALPLKIKDADGSPVRAVLFGG